MGLPRPVSSAGRGSSCCWKIRTSSKGGTLGTAHRLLRFAQFAVDASGGAADRGAGEKTWRQHEDLPGGFWRGVRSVGRAAAAEAGAAAAGVSVARAAAVEGAFGDSDHHPAEILSVWRTVDV